MATGGGARVWTWGDRLHYAFFASHIPITLMLDSQAVLPASCFPSVLREVAKWYCTTFKDPLMSQPPLWFKSMVTCELALQLPFFAAALYAMHTGGSWIRLPGIAYSAHVATTLVPVLTELVLGDVARETLPLKKRLLLAAIYSPYLLVPLHYGYTLWANPNPYRQRDNVYIDLVQYNDGPSAL